MKKLQEIVSLRPLIGTPKIQVKVIEPLIECGFPLPHEGEEIFKPAIDIGREIVPNTVTTYVGTAWSDSMEPYIHQGDMLLVDKALSIKNGNYIAGTLNGGWFMKRYWKDPDGRITLHSENGNYQPIEVKEYMHYREFGRIYMVLQSL